MRLKAEPLLHKDALISKFDGREAEQNLSRGSKAADYNEYLILFFFFFKDAVICQISLYRSSELSSLQRSLFPPLLSLS